MLSSSEIVEKMKTFSFSEKNIWLSCYSGDRLIIIFLFWFCSSVGFKVQWHVLKLRLFCWREVLLVLSYMKMAISSFVNLNLMQMDFHCQWSKLCLRNMAKLYCVCSIDLLFYPIHLTDSSLFIKKWLYTIPAST